MRIEMLQSESEFWFMVHAGFAFWYVHFDLHLGINSAFICSGLFLKLWLDYETCRARHCIRRVSQDGRMAKHASDRPATCPPESRRQEVFLLSPRNICVPLPTNFAACCIINWDTSRGHVSHDNFTRDMSSSLVRPLRLYSEECQTKKAFKHARKCFRCLSQLILIQMDL